MTLRSVADELARCRLAVLRAETAVESIRLCNRLDYRALASQYERLRQQVADLREQVEKLS